MIYVICQEKTFTACYTTGISKAWHPKALEAEIGNILMWNQLELGFIFFCSFVSVMVEYPVNKEFPPDFKKYGTKHNGYKNDVQEQIFYDFATIGYDLEVHYKGGEYYFANDPKGVCRCRVPFSIPMGCFYRDANDMIKNFRFDDGRLFVEAIDDIDYADPW